MVVASFLLFLNFEIFLFICRELEVVPILYVS